MASPALDGSAAFPATHTSERVRSDGLARLWSLLFGRVDIAGIAFFRIVFGAIMVWEVWRYATLGWITRYYVEPAFHFTYIGFDWVRPLPGVGMYVLFGALALLGLGIAVGFSYRLCTALFFVGYTYVFFLEQATFNNHYYLIALLSFLLILVSAHRALSVDAWRRPGLRSQTAPG